MANKFSHWDTSIYTALRTEGWRGCPAQPATNWSFHLPHPPHHSLQRQWSVTNYIHNYYNIAHGTTIHWTMDSINVYICILNSGAGIHTCWDIKMVITTHERIFVATPTIISYKRLSLWFHRIVSCYMYIKVLIPANSFYPESVVSQCFGIAQIVSFKRLRYQPVAWEMPRIQRLECEYHTLLPWN